VLDNCFTLDTQECQPLCVLRNAAKKIEVQLFPDESYQYLQIYTPPHRKSIAIENLSGAPDGFNNMMGVITLEPGQSSLFKTSYKIVLLN
jgi:aldose 1-epimerase